MIFFLTNFSYNFGATLLDNFSVLAVFFAITVIVYKNPVHSILSLIGLFLIVSLYLFVEGMLFAALAYILVYVGAVTILFLFILMLLDIRISELLSQPNNSIPLVAIVSISLGFMLANPMGSDSFSFTLSIEDQIIAILGWDSIISTYNHIAAIGNILYSNASIWLIVTSIILLLAMVGAIVITLKPQVIGRSNLESSLPVMQCNVFAELGYCLAPAIAFIGSAGNELAMALSITDHAGIASFLQQAIDNMEAGNACLADAYGPARQITLENPTDPAHFVVSATQQSLNQSQHMAVEASNLHQANPEGNYPHTSLLMRQALAACRQSEQFSSRTLDHIKASGHMPDFDS